MKTGSTGRREIISRNKTDSGSSTLVPPTHASRFFFSGRWSVPHSAQWGQFSRERQDFT